MALGPVGVPPTGGEKMPVPAKAVVRTQDDDMNAKSNGPHHGQVNAAIAQHRKGMVGHPST